MDIADMVFKYFTSFERFHFNNKNEKLLQGFIVLRNYSFL